MAPNKCRARQIEERGWAIKDWMRLEKLGVHLERHDWKDRVQRPCNRREPVGQAAHTH